MEIIKHLLKEIGYLSKYCNCSWYEFSGCWGVMELQIKVISVWNTMFQNPYFLFWSVSFSKPVIKHTLPMSILESEFVNWFQLFPINYFPITFLHNLHPSYVNNIKSLLEISMSVTPNSTPYILSPWLIDSVIITLSWIKNHNKNKWLP